MVNKLLLRILLLPFSLLFGIGVALKSLLYDVGLLSGVSFNIPVISVGNLTVGGAGKTPHVEYLIRQLSPYLQVAVLSRGYRRKTGGFHFARPHHTSDQVGDEPLLYARKYRNIVVAVSESRALGIPKLLQHRPDIKAILLDDAFQHRAVTPGLNILLTEFSDPFYDDWLLPAGRLREWPQAYKRADLVIVTKCPPDLSEEARDEMISKINPTPAQEVFFSRYVYYNPYAMWAPDNRLQITDAHEVLLICGIARTNYLLDYLHRTAGGVRIMQYEDHHVYTRYDLEMIIKHFGHMESPRKIVLTTEKDAMRLESFRDILDAHNMTIFILPIKVEFMFDDAKRFEACVKQYLLDFKV